MTLFGRAVWVWLLVAVVQGAPLDKLAAGVSEFTLANGLRVIVLERHATPVVAFHLRSRMGSADEPPGKSGVSLMVETMFFRGGELTGSTDPATESSTLAKAEEWFDQRDAELARGSAANLLTAQDYKLKARVLIDSVSRLGVEAAVARGFAINQFENVGFHVRADSTDLAATGPANRAELWFRLVGDWLQRPSLRGYYADRENLQMELEQRQRNSIVAKLHATLLPAAFATQPYSKLAAAAGELENARARDAVAFIRTAFSGRNLVLAIVGDIGVDSARSLAETYFGKLPAGTSPDWKPSEPQLLQTEKRLQLTDDNESIWSVSWLRPSRGHADDVAFDVMAALLNGDAEAPLRRELMGDRPLANHIQVTPAFPSDRFGSLFSIVVAPSLGADPKEIEAAVQRAIKSLAEQPVDAAALASAKTRIEAKVFQDFSSHAGLAHFLARTSSDNGSTARFAATYATIQSIGAEAVQKLAVRYLKDSQRIVVSGGQGQGTTGDAE
ncbi:MAG: insulinase family protein [Bryobacterales bacterium]|nr:insulinase family protein [Bryobacterales bacterium]